ncbi:MAG: dimethylmenaquinone methyltransferase [Bryobacterales bacterium]|nr:dimethylmenaquinone methyltransferase [Bryobacterales bacterium]
MFRSIIVGLSLVALTPATGQVFMFDRDQMVRYTANNPFDRFPNGRPKVPDNLLEQMRRLSAEDIFGVLNGAKYPNQFEGGFRLLHPGRKLVGRAVTAQFMPLRPDVADVAEADAKAKGLARSANQRVIDMLQPGDVIVVDMFGKIENGTFVGDNLATAIFSATGGNGFVVDGAIRDLEGIVPLQMAAYFRGVHPSAIGNVMLTAVNVPVRIGQTTVMPGDVVFGDREGIYFVPPQFVQPILDRAVETHLHDEWTKDKFMTGKYKSSELYPTPLDPAVKAEYEAWKKQRQKK